MEAMCELILKLTSLADMVGESLKIESNPVSDGPITPKYTISIGDSVYYTDRIDFSRLTDALMAHSLNLSDKISKSSDT